MTGTTGSENVLTRGTRSEPLFSLSEVTDNLRAWTNLDAVAEDDDERVVQRTCRRLISMFEHLATSKENDAADTRL